MGGAFDTTSAADGIQKLALTANSEQERAAARRVLQAQGAADLLPMLGLDQTDD